MIANLFRAYYRSMRGAIYVPDVIRREFMFRGFDGRVRRHMAFGDLEELRRYLVYDPPLDAYYSVSLYERPEAEMEDKGRIRADLLFDVDSSDLRDEGCESGSIWRCKGCGKLGMGLSPARCPSCGSDRIEVNHWLNERCIEVSREEVRKLIEILTQDLGVDQDWILVTYTGNRGFHVRVIDGPLTQLEREARREIAQYVMASGLDISSFISADGRGFILDTRSGHVARALRLMRGSDPMGHMRLSPREKRNLERALISSVSKSAARIDWMVTMDTGRLTRVPNSLHGKTGFRALSLTLDDYRTMDPFKDAVGIQAEPEMSLRIKLRVPRFRMRGEAFGPYSEGEEVRLPAHAASFLVLRGRAELYDSGSKD
ncbi:MAG: DNA primase small subunit domain-containing protein [Candidatus Korarchaeum sp.]